jgi:sensor histidine kinase YesM
MRRERTSKTLTSKDIKIYVVFWILYIIFFTFQRYYSYRGEPDKETLFTSFFINLIYLPDAVIFTHFIVNFVNPRFFFTNRHKFFYVILATTVLLYPLVPFLVRTQIVNKYIKLDAEPYDMGNYFATILIYFFSVTILAFSNLTRHMKEESIVQQKLDNDRLLALLKLKEMELKLLKSQIYPHFLFNTLNNLYSPTLEKSEKTPDLIIRLADMLSYIIYDGGSEKVPLSKEIEFIKSYIELQKVRYESCDITLNINCDTGNKFIAPMILHTFIDNSFKHGADRDSGDPWIKISITSNNGSLHLTVVNSIKKTEDKEFRKPGIGISNAQKRLELLYQGRYELLIDKTETMYSVNLRLDL